MRPRRAGSLLAPGIEVLEHLRRGNDLDVYACEDHARRCPVVVKALRPDRAPGSDAGRRLLREGRLLRRLPHPHLVACLDVLREPRPLVVQETLPGATLGALVLERRLSVRETAVVGLQLGGALGWLHAHDVVHLDVKPSNVVADGTRAKLLDLSIARPRGSRVRPGHGTWCAAAPEQCRGGVVDAPADVWGLGLLLHEALTGESTFDVDGERHEHPQLHRPAERARTLRRGVPPVLDDLLAACLAFDAQDRPALPDVLAALRPLAAG